MSQDQQEQEAEAESEQGEGEDAGEQGPDEAEQEVGQEAALGAPWDKTGWAELDKEEQSVQTYTYLAGVAGVGLRGVVAAARAPTAALHSRLHLLSLPPLVRHRARHPVAVLNVGGERHAVSWELLQQAEIGFTSRLGALGRATTRQAALELGATHNINTQSVFLGLSNSKYCPLDLNHRCVWTAASGRLRPVLQ